ncbi:Protein Tat like [Melia azedarach]|uniref:Protein Tat like n=1 Tax=Melia azedarach TaxID=155640 RepID=A0ACC1X9V9_MELAZ|nr:Protein Tat like [Melia azedarach]
MAPPANLDLILLAFLHGSFIACILLVFVFLILIAMLLAFSLTVFSIVVFDLYNIFSLFYSHIQTVEANLELGFVLFLCTMLRQAIAVVSASQPWYERNISNFKEKAQRIVSRIDALMLVKTRRL